MIHLFKKKKKEVPNFPKQDGFYIDSRNLNDATYGGTCRVPFGEFIRNEKGELIDITTNGRPPFPKDRTEIH